MDKLVDKVTYEIYVKSFYDSDNDGYGDLNGIITKLNYLARLGIDTIMLDGILVNVNSESEATADFKAIAPKYGTLADFDNLVAKARQLNISVGIKFSINHTSLNHPWFKAASAGDKKYQDYYITVSDEQIATEFDTQVLQKWHKLDETGYHYLHLADDVADLNWRNPAILAEFKDIFTFWLSHGVQLFQLQDAELIGKNLHACNEDSLAEMLKLHAQTAVEYLDLLDMQVFKKYPSVQVIIEQLTHASERPSFNKIWAKPNFATYSDTHLLIDYQKNDRWTLVPYDFDDLRHVIHNGGIAHQNAPRQTTLFWDSPDQSRALNRFILHPEYYKDGAKLLGMLLLAGQGAPILYMGEEIGMEDPQYDHIDQYIGKATKVAYAKLLTKGYTEERAFAVIRNRSSDNARVPMPWDSSEAGGFTNGKPWLTPGDYLQLNANYELEKDYSVFTFYRDMIALRKKAASLRYGEYQPAYEQTPELLAFIRHYGKENMLVLAHFGDTAATIELPAEVTDCEVVISNYFTTELTQKYRLRPYEALIIKY